MLAATAGPASAATLPADSRNLAAVFAGAQPGDTVELSVVNGSQKRTVSVTLGNRPASVKQ